MATPLDTTLIAKLGDLFPFLLVLVTLLGIFSYTGIFKDNKALQAFTAFAIAVLFMLSDIAVETVRLMAPWFVILFMFIMFLLLSYKMFGATDKDIMAVVKGDKYGSLISYWVLALVLIIVLGSFSFAVSKRGGFGPMGGGTVEAVNGTGVPSQQAEFWNTITHPKTLGMVLILLIATFTIMKLTA